MFSYILHLQGIAYIDDGTECPAFICQRKVKIRSSSFSFYFFLNSLKCDVCPALQLANNRATRKWRITKVAAGKIRIHFAGAYCAGLPWIWIGLSMDISIAAPWIYPWIFYVIKFE